MPPSSRLIKGTLLTRTLVGGAALVLVAAIAQIARAASAQVKGHITGQEKLVPDVYQEAAKPEAHRFTWREPSPTVRPEFRVLAANPSREICIAAFSEKNEPPPPSPVLIRITGGRTIPTTIVLASGTKVVFENHDPFPHRLYIPNAPAFKAENMNTGGKREWTAPAGKARFEFRDELFPSVRSFIVVDPGVVEIAYPGRDGVFFFQNLAAGDYKLQGFFNGRPVSKPMAITTKNQVLELRDALALDTSSSAGQ
jgi:hypothetical protein